MTKQEFLEATKGYVLPGVVLAVDFENIRHMQQLIVQARELLEPPKPKKIEMVCSTCGSDEVLCDAYAEWCVETQDWILHSTYDKGAHCDRCGGECRIVEQEIEG